MFDPLLFDRSPRDCSEPDRSAHCSPTEMAEYAARCAVRHLVVAAVELARDPEIPRDRASRFSRAEAKFRALTDFDGISHGSPAAVTSPCVLLPDGTNVPITELLVGACQLLRFRLPYRSIDSELVYAAKELLSGLSWHFPDDSAKPVSRPVLPLNSSRLSPSSDPG